MEERQKQFERAEFQLLREQELASQEESSGDTFLLVRSWYTAWEEWVMGRAREPPGENGFYLSVRIPSLF